MILEKTLKMTEEESFRLLELALLEKGWLASSEKIARVEWDDGLKFWIVEDSEWSD